MKNLIQQSTQSINYLLYNIIINYESSHNKWNDDRHGMYDANVDFAKATIIAFIVALTQYSVSHWIWSNGKSKHRPRRSPVYLVFGAGLSSG